MVAGAANALEVADFAGNWSLVEMNTPKVFHETYYNVVSQTYRSGENGSSDYAHENEILVGAEYPVPVDARSEGLTFSASGELNDGTGGRIVSVNGGRLLYREDGEVESLYVNTTGDVILAGGSDEEEQYLGVALKHPDSLALADLAGDWRLAMISLPEDISTNSVYGRLVDTWFSDDGYVETGGLSVSAGGAVSGDVSGSLAVSGPGAVTMTVDGNALTFRVNASKDVMAAAADDDDVQELILLVKKPDALAVADLEGTWRVMSLVVPSELIEVFYNAETGALRQAANDGVAGTNESLVDLYHEDEFMLWRDNVAMSGTGSFTAVDGSGSFSVSSGRTVTINDGEDTMLAAINASKTVMVMAVEDESTRELTVLVKTSEAVAEGDEVFDLSVQSGEDGSLVLMWNGGSGVELEETSDLGGVWSAVADTDGKNVLEVQPEGGAKFFRVKATSGD